MPLRPNSQGKTAQYGAVKQPCVDDHVAGGRQGGRMLILRADGRTQPVDFPGEQSLDHRGEAQPAFIVSQFGIDAFQDIAVTCVEGGIPLAPRAHRNPWEKGDAQGTPHGCFQVIEQIRHNAAAPVKNGQAVGEVPQAIRSKNRQRARFAMNPRRDGACFTLVNAYAGNNRLRTMRGHCLACFDSVAPVGKDHHVPRIFREAVAAVTGGGGHLVKQFFFAYSTKHNLCSLFKSL